MNKQESVGIHQTGHNTPGLTEVLHGQDAQEPDHHLDSLLTSAAGQEDLVLESVQPLILFRGVWGLLEHYLNMFLVGRGHISVDSTQMAGFVLEYNQV